MRQALPHWALRSGWLAPSMALRLTCREKPISTSSLRTLLGLIEWPIAASADASLSRLRHPQQRTDRIAQRRRLDQAFEIIEQRRVTFSQGPRAATFTPNLAAGKRWRIEVFQSALDGAARQPGDARDPRKSTPAGGADLARSEQPPPALVPLRTVRFPPLPNRLLIDHANAGSAQRGKRRSLNTESHRRMAMGAESDSLIDAAVLSR